MSGDVLQLTFELVGVSKREAEEWGELIVDACRLDPRAHVTLTDVRLVGHEYPLRAVVGEDSDE